MKTVLNLKFLIFLIFIGVLFVLGRSYLKQEPSSRLVVGSGAQECSGTGSNELWVDGDYAAGNSYTATGSLATPYATIQEAIDNSSDDSVICVVESEASYAVPAATINGQILYGGFAVNAARDVVVRDPDTSITLLQISSSDTMFEDVTLDGFEIYTYNSTTQFGLYFENAGIISDNTIHTGVGSGKSVKFRCNDEDGCDLTVQNNTIYVDSTLLDGSSSSGVVTGEGIHTFDVVTTEHDFNVFIDSNIVTLSSDPDAFTCFSVLASSSAHLSSEITNNQCQVTRSYTYLSGITGVHLDPQNQYDDYQERAVVGANTFTFTGTSSVSPLIAYVINITGVSAPASDSSVQFLVEKNIIYSKTTTVRQIAIWGTLEVTLANNLIVSDGCSRECVGIFVYSDLVGRVDIFNNHLVFLNTTSPLGVRLYGSNGGYIENNLFYADMAGAMIQQDGSYYEFISSIKNNYLYTTGTSSYLSSDICSNSRITDLSTLHACDTNFSNNLGGSDPLFTDISGTTDITAMDFSLQSISPAIDMGKIAADVIESLNNVVRYCGNGFDIGAYEYDSGSCATGYDIDGDGLDNATDDDDDGDGTVDWFDSDDDNDGVDDEDDDFPWDASEWGDGDNDGTGDNADTDDDNDGTPDTEDEDDDNDGVPDTEDDFPSDPARTTDTDGDGVADNIDWDDDGNGIYDGTGDVDTDEDGIGDDGDTDDDNDGYPDSADEYPLDASEWIDGDNDGIPDNQDTDDDNDGTLDSEDADDDNDGVPDTEDTFPSDPSESVDTDGDGVGDNADDFDTNAAEWTDTDGDGTGDNADTDDDGDGILDSEETAETTDTDGDGTPDSEDEDDDNDGTPDTEDEDDDGDGISDVSEEDTSSKASGGCGCNLEGKNSPDNILIQVFLFGFFMVIVFIRRLAL